MFTPHIITGTRNCRLLTKIARPKEAKTCYGIQLFIHYTVSVRIHLLTVLSKTNSRCDATTYQIVDSLVTVLSSLQTSLVQNQKNINKVDENVR